MVLHGGMIVCREIDLCPVGGEGERRKREFCACDVPIPMKRRATK